MRASLYVLGGNVSLPVMYVVVTSQFGSGHAPGLGLDTIPDIILIINWIIKSMDLTSRRQLDFHKNILTLMPVTVESCSLFHGDFIVESR